MWGCTESGHVDDASNAVVAQAVGAVIATVELVSGGKSHSGRSQFNIHFVDGRLLRIVDDKQSCCEDRFITCDDDLSTFSGATLVSIDARVSSSRSEDLGDLIGIFDDVAFVNIVTSKGTIVLTTHNEHNEHNGYYGGFHLLCAFVEPTIGVQ